MQELVCEKCGSTKNVIVHHLSYEPEITKTLCLGCYCKKEVHQSIKRPHNFSSKIARNITGKMNVTVSIDIDIWREWLAFSARKTGSARKSSEMVTKALEFYMKQNQE